MNGTATHSRILVLSRPGSPSSDRVSQIFPEAEVRTVSSFDEAVAALRDGQYDLVISDQRDFLALERASINHQATLLLETIGQGVCIVALDGRLVWSNPKMQSYPADLQEKVCEVCAKTFGVAVETDPEQPSYHRARRFSLTGGQDQYFDLTVTPVETPRGELSQVAAVVWDVTHSRRLQKKIDAIDLAGRELARIDAETFAGMNVEQRIALLEEKMHGYLKELLNFDKFAVLLIDKKTNKLDFVFHHGLSQKSRDYEIYAEPTGNGTSGYVAATGQSYICKDTSSDPLYLQGLDSTGSSLTVPLRLRDAVIGVLDIESDQVNAFNEDDKQFAEILARYVAIALNTLDLLIIERYEFSGQLVDDVCSEVAGPVNDIIAESQGIMDEYIGNDSLRRRIAAICENAKEISKRIKAAGTTRAGILGRHNDATPVDPLINGKRILVADDDQTIRETIAELLTRRGGKIDMASDGSEAIARIEQNVYDLVLSDIRMPHKNGYEVFSAARDKRADCPVILMTGFGYDPNHSIVRARPEGLSAVLFKPFMVDQLIEEVRKALLPVGTGGQQ